MTPLLYFRQKLYSGPVGCSRSVPAESHVCSCKGLAKHEVIAQSDFEEPPLTLLSQGLSSAVEVAVGRMVEQEGAQAQEHGTNPSSVQRRCT